MQFPGFTPNRRALIAMLFAAPFVAACKKQASGPEEIRWGREVCAICGMIISEPNFAAELRGGADRGLYKFDDIGDAVHWLRVQPWADDPDVEFWVRDYETGTRWLDARAVRYLAGVQSPMDYGFAAVETGGDGTLSYGEMVEAVVRIGLTSRCLPTEGQES